MKPTVRLGIACVFWLILAGAVCTPTPPHEPDGQDDFTVGGVVPAEKSADFADHWSCLDVADGQIWIYRGYLQDGVTSAEEYDVAISYGRHSEPAAEGTDLLFRRYWTVSTSMHNSPVWVPDTNLYGWMRGEEDGVWYVGYSAGDGVFQVRDAAELIFPGGGVPPVGHTWGEYRQTVGFPDPVEELTWSHRLEAVNVAITTELGVFEDCLEIYNRKESRIEYWSCAASGLVGWRQVLDDHAMDLGRWNKLTLITTDPDWHTSYDLNGD